MGYFGSSAWHTCTHYRYMMNYCCSKIFTREKEHSTRIKKLLLNNIPAFIWKVTLWILSTETEVSQEHLGLYTVKHIDYNLKLPVSLIILDYTWHCLLLKFQGGRCELPKARTCGMQSAKSGGSHVWASHAHVYRVSLLIDSIHIFLLISRLFFQRPRALVIND